MNHFPTPEFERYMAMWNEPDPVARRRHLDFAVADDVVFCDPANFHIGRDALERNATALHAEEPDYEYQVASGFDHHHDRYRYAWQIVKHGEVVLKGMDVTTVDEHGKLQRIDGFFGPLPQVPAES